MSICSLGFGPYKQGEPQATRVRTSGILPSGVSAFVISSLQAGSYGANGILFQRTETEQRPVNDVITIIIIIMSCTLSHITLRTQKLLRGTRVVFTLNNFLSCSVMELNWAG